MYNDIAALAPKSSGYPSMPKAATLSPYYAERLIMAFAMHLQILPQTKIGFNMMKFAINHPERFHEWNIAFYSGFFTAVIPIIIVALTTMNLSTQTSVVNIISSYVYFSAIANIPTIFATPLKQEPLFKLLKDRPLALRIERTSSSKNMWRGEHYYESMFGLDFKGLVIPDEIYDKWFEAYTAEETRLDLGKGSITKGAIRQGDKGSEKCLTFTNKRTSLQDLFVPKKMSRTLYFKERTCWNKCLFVLYKFLKWFYTSVYFYLMPFTVLLLEFYLQNVINFSFCITC